MSERRRSRRDILFSGISAASTTWKQKVYSVRFGNIALTTVGSREDDAIGMVAEVGVGDQIVRNDFDNVDFFNRPICNCVANHYTGRWDVTAYLGDKNFAWDGSNGMVMYECTPFYISDNSNMSTYVSVCRYPQDGYTLAPMFDNAHDKIYRACFPMNNRNWPSTANQIEFTSKIGLIGRASKNTFSSIVKSNGGLRIEGMDCLYSDYALQLVEFANKIFPMKGYISGAWGDGQTPIVTSVDGVGKITVTSVVKPINFVVGQNIHIGTNAVANSNGLEKGRITNIIDNGSNYTIEFESDYTDRIQPGMYVKGHIYDNGDALMHVKASSGSPGSNIDGKHPCVWRGKENPWGNLYQLIGGVLTQNTGLYQAPDDLMIANLNTNINDVIDKLTLISNLMPSGAGSMLDFGNKWGWLIPRLGGGSASGAASPYSTRANGLQYIRCCRFGGYFANSTGNMRFDTYDAPWESSINTCARFYAPKGLNV